MPGGRSYMRGAGVVPDREICRIGKVDQVGKCGAADEIDRTGASGTDLAGERFLARSANNNRESIGCVEQPSGQLAIALCRPTLCRVARRGAGNQQKETAPVEPGR